VTLATAAANALWTATGLRARRRYRAALRRPLLTQGALLARYLHENRDTSFGRTYKFEDILTSARGDCSRVDEICARNLAAEFQGRVPLSTYEDLAPFVQRIRAGEPALLTRSRVRRLIPSSGSTSAAKLIPSTIEGQRELACAVDAWISDLYLAHPSLAAGPAYWSISPAIPTDRSGAVPVGFDNDSAYLGVMRRTLARAILVVPDAIAGVSDGDAFRYITLLFLVRARELRLVSIWHPTFFTRLLDGLPEWLDRIGRDIADGTLTPPGHIQNHVRARFRDFLKPDRKRALEIARLQSIDPSTLWPRFRAVSCWADGPAMPYAEELGKLLPEALLQAKGLIATEGIVTIPFQQRHPLAVRSHFFEFLDSDNRSHLAHELERSREYRVVLTTGAGLYRYCLGDRVEVDGWVEGTPSLRFIGKDDRISDRFGEKVSDGFAARVIDALFGHQRPRFVMLAPERTPAGTAYTLFVESGAPLPSTLAAALERELRRNPHYAWCVDLGQLRPSRAMAVGPGADRAFVDACVAKGQRRGDVKPVALHRDSGWESVLPRASYDPDTERAAC
jgi:GH3 auxin-responsive promoter